MTTIQGSHEEFQMNKDQSEFNYWQNQMKGDTQFVQYMTELYKKQQLDARNHETINRRMTHYPKQQTTRHLPQLMDYPVLESPNQQQFQHDDICTIQTSTDYYKAPPRNQVSSTPRRPPDESGSSEKQPQRQAKKARPQEPTPTMVPQTSATAPATRQFGFPIFHLRHAIDNKLPCFYIKFVDDGPQFQAPSIMKVARWIRQTVQQETGERVEDFSLFVPAGNNRYKFGVASKNDFLKLWKCKWPGKMEQMNVEIERPRALPDCCAVVVRHVPTELSNEFVLQEISKSIKTATSLSKIKYHRPRAANDYRFCVTDADEYEEVLSIGRISIGHLLFPINAFTPGLNMTYCTNCWELGHTRSQCKLQPRCRHCLEAWHYNHQCEKPLCCAQCQGPHFSLSSECIVVKNYRKTLKEEVNIAVKEGLLRQVEHIIKPDTFNRVPLEFPTLKQANGTNQAWPNRQNLAMESLKEHGKEQLSELMTQINGVLDITRRTEMKIDNQVLRLETLDKKLSINKQGMMVLASIMQQTINALSEKKNKQHLQNLYHQLEEFKNDIMEKFNTFSIDQQSTSDASSPQANLKNTSKTTATMPTTTTVISIGHGNNKQVEQEHSMEITNG